MKDWRLKPEAYDKYAYATKNPWPVRILYAAGILSWLGVLYGYGLFLDLSPWYWLVFGPLIAVITLYHFLNYGIGLFYKGFNIDTHNALLRRYWSGRREMPSVDIFLPVCGESLGILEWTFAAVKDINYPDKRVFVLDDKGSAETRRLAEKLGFTYISRPNRGEMKKAGNLKYGLEHSRGEFFVIFDADFAPHQDFLVELLPYMHDPKVGIVQSPQAFQTDGKVHKRSPLEYGAGHVQEDFYRIIQTSRDTFGGAICVGSNAVYRRSAIEAVGGLPQVEHSEDVLTGFNLLDGGFKVKYVPVILAMGLCPENVHTYFHQQHRWCSGSMGLCLSRRFFNSRLTIAQKICYFTGFLYYVTHALSLLLAFQIYAVLLFHYDVIDLRHALPFVPHLIVTFAVLPFFRSASHRYGTSLARAAQVMSSSHAVFSHVIGKGLDWQPSGSKKMRAAVPFIALVGFNAVYFFAHVVFVAIAIADHKFPVFELDYYSVIFWVLYNLVASLLFLVHGYRQLKMLRADEKGGRLSPTAVGIAVVLLFAGLSMATAGAASLYAAVTPKPAYAAAQPPPMCMNEANGVH